MAATASAGELVGMPLEPVASEPATIHAASEIAVTYSASQLQIRIGIGVDCASAGELQNGLLGGDLSEAALADALRELANTAAGGFARGALACNAQLTIGMPSNRDLVSGAASHEGRAFRLVAPGGSLVLHCVAIVSECAPKLVVASELREGMVLARDVMNSNGLLTVPAGTALTRATVQQLGRVLGAIGSYEVNEAAA